MKTKSLILTTLSLIPIFATAQSENFNFYGKAGIDLTSRFETFKVHSGRDESYHYFSRGSKKNTFSPSIFLETTYNILPPTEIGLGVGYIKRKGFNYYHEYDLFKEEYKINRYSSVPIYAILKQNYSLNPNTKIYFKSDLGYSFNKTRRTLYKANSPPYRNTIHFKTKDGLYLGLGVGVEYKSFLAEIGYYHTNSAVTYVSRHYKTNAHSSYNNDALRLSIGFKF